MPLSLVCKGKHVEQITVSSVVKKELLLFQSTFEAVEFPSTVFN